MSDYTTTPEEEIASLKQKIQEQAEIIPKSNTKNPWKTDW